MALHSGDPRAAADHLEALGPLDLGQPGLTIYLRARAHLASGDAERALAEYNWILDHRGRYWHNLGPSITLPFQQLALLGSARAHAALGDTSAARRAYEDVLALWQEADPDFEPALQAKRELTALGS